MATDDEPRPRSDVRSSYWRVWLTFAGNSLIRDMSFRSNFWIQAIAGTSWVFMNLGFFLLVFSFTDSIGDGTGWGKHEFFVFLATTLLVNSLVQMFFLPNMQEFSEQIRTGALDFALLKPIDAQFLISCQKMEWSSLANFFVGLGLLAYALLRLDYAPGAWEFVLYPVYVLCGVAILYSLMIVLASTSIWLGRNQSLYDFWFYITNFSRYPMEIYSGPLGTPLQWLFTFLVPILVVVNVPARFLAKPLQPSEGWLAVFAVAAAVGSLAFCRWLFQRALHSYRSASS